MQEKAEKTVREAAAKGANIILLQVTSIWVGNCELRGCLQNPLRTMFISLTRGPRGSFVHTCPEVCIGFSNVQGSRSQRFEARNAVDMQELFETPYFCQDQKQDLFELARPFEGNPVLERFAKLAAELSVVLPISYFEHANNAFYNSLAVFDADGSCAGRYRKSHIPDGPG